MKKTIVSLIIVGSAVSCVMLSGCGESRTGTDSFAAGPTSTGTINTTPTVASMIDGAALYASNCAGCHGPLANTSKSGASVSMIQTGIAGIGSMKHLSTLTSAQVQAISDALNGITSTTPTGTTTVTPTATTPPATATGTSIDGATLYAGNCAACHGPLATSAKLGATAALIQTGISNVRAMSFLSSLTSAQIQAIATALAPAAATPPATTPTTPPVVTPAPLDGAALYAQDCAGCHNALASSNKRKRTAAQIQTAINNNRGGMGSLSSLTAAQVQAIATALNF